MSELRSMLIGPNQRAALQEASDIYANQMDQSLLDYLEGRGIGHSVAVGASLGLVVEPLPGHESYRGCLSIPYITKSGVVALKFRRLRDGNGPKYLALPNQRPRMYNVNDLHLFSRYVVITEGELSALVSSKVVGIPSVGVAGTNMWYPHMARLFEDYEKVFIVTDNDGTTDEDGEPSKGQGLARKIQKDIKGAVNIMPPTGLDLDEWVLADGVEAVRKGILG